VSELLYCYFYCRYTGRFKKCMYTRLAEEIDKVNTSGRRMW
jgi:hypothetical protein